MSHKVAMATAPGDVAWINDAQRAGRGIGSGRGQQDGEVETQRDSKPPAAYVALRSQSAALSSSRSTSSSRRPLPDRTSGWSAASSNGNGEDGREADANGRKRNDRFRGGNRGKLPF